MTDIEKRSIQAGGILGAIAGYVWLGPVGIIGLGLVGLFVGLWAAILLGPRYN